MGVTIVVSAFMMPGFVACKREGKTVWLGPIGEMSFRGIFDDMVVSVEDYAILKEQFEEKRGRLI